MGVDKSSNLPLQLTDGNLQKILSLAAFIKDLWH